MTMFIKECPSLALQMIKDPWQTLTKVSSQSSRHSVTFLLTIGTVTALLTPVQVLLGFEDINGLHAGGQAEFLAKDISNVLGLELYWRPLLIEALYIVILLVTTGYLHLILRTLGGKASLHETIAMIAFGDAPGLLFGWIPYFATVSGIWAATIQLLLGPVIVHKLPWSKAIAVFSLLLGLGIIDIALS